MRSSSIWVRWPLIQLKRRLACGAKLVARPLALDSSLLGLPSASSVALLCVSIRLPTRVISVTRGLPSAPVCDVS